MEVYVFQPNLKEIELSPENEWHDEMSEGDWLQQMKCSTAPDIIVGDKHGLEDSYSLYMHHGCGGGIHSIICASDPSNNLHYYVLYTYLDYLKFLEQVFPLYAAARAEHRAEFLFSKKMVER
jgi:hypothetical protein